MPPVPGSWALATIGDVALTPVFRLSLTNPTVLRLSILGSPLLEHAETCKLVDLSMENNLPFLLYPSLGLKYTLKIIIIKKFC